MEAIKILIVDDQMLIREGIASLLKFSDQVKVVGQASDGEEAIAQVKALQPDVILMDVRMPKMNGIETIKYLSELNILKPTIILTTFDEHELLIECLKAGAKGYLLKDVSLETLVDAINQVNSGNTLVQPGLTERMLRGLTQLSETTEKSHELIEPLSRKELEVIRLMAGGYSNKEIANSINNSEGTIKNHVSNILTKLNVRDRTRAVLKAIEQGLI